MQQWRGIMAKKLVYATAGEPMAAPPAMPELALVGGTPGAKASVTFLNEAMRPAGPIVVDQEWPNCIICMQSADPICAGDAMSNSIVRRTVWITAGVWAVLVLAVIIQSMLGVTVAGARPEASRLIIMMTLPFTVGMSAVAIGAAMAIGWWRSRRPAASGND